LLDKNRRYIGKSQSKRPSKRTQRTLHHDEEGGELLNVSTTSVPPAKRAPRSRGPVTLLPLPPPYSSADSRSTKRRASSCLRGESARIGGIGGAVHTGGVIR
jgi:hypothetical protein